MIEQAAGQDYADALAEHVLEPLGLDETSLPTDTEIPEPFIHGYDVDDEGEFEDLSNVVAGGWTWSSGGMVSTPADLNDFIRGCVGGELYGNEVRDQQQDLFVPGGTSDPVGVDDAEERGPGGEWFDAEQRLREAAVCFALED